MIRTIIVPTDGSSHADKATGMAADLAGKYKAKLRILHALLHNETPAGLRQLLERIAAPEELVKQLDEETGQMVATVGSAYAEVPVLIPLSVELLEAIGQCVCDHARQIARQHGATEITVDIANSAPVDAILAAARHEHADMIVMGSRGLGRIEGMLIGSVSQRVNHHAACTCVTVK